jgi:hypothetical protein
LVYESLGERDFIFICLADPRVEDIQAQPPAVTYVDSDGFQRKHTFDFLVKRSGLWIAVAIKPSRKLASSDLERIVALIRSQVGTRFADRYVILTEQHLHPDDVYNATLIYRARRIPNASADAAIRSLVDKLWGRVRIDDLVRLSGLEGAAFNAVVRLIGSGALRCCDGSRIRPDSIVHVIRPCNA